MKIVFQVILTFIVLAIGILLFILIPKPFESSYPGLGALGIFVLPFSIAFYVSVVGVLGISIWNLIAFIFKEVSDEEESVEEENITPHVSKNKKYNYQPNLKEQVDSLNTAIKHTNTTTDTNTNTQRKNNSLIFSTFKIGSWIVGISFAAAFAILAYFIVLIQLGEHKSEIKKYSAHYEANDYNDNRIKYYVHELDINSQKLIESDNIYDDVVANIKREISLECIKVFRKEHNVTKKHQADKQIKNFMLNARNHSVTTDKMREISIKKEKFLRYNHSRSTYGLSNPSLQLQESCQKTISVNTIFQQVMPLYIQYEEKSLKEARTNALIYSTSSKYLTSKEKWVETLHEKYPQFTHKKED